MSESSKPQESNSVARTRPRRFGLKRKIGLTLLLLGLAALAHIWYWGGRIDRQTYRAADLTAGPVTQICAWNASHSAVQISRLSSVSADRLWRVVTDQGRFDEFMPYVRSTTVEPGDNGKLLEKQILDLPYGSFDLVLEIELTERPKVRRAQWRQIMGSLDFNEGAWTVEQEGQQTILRYEVAATVNWMPQAIVNYAMRRRLGRLLEAVEQRVRDLEQREPEYFSQL